MQKNHVFDCVFTLQIEVKQKNKQTAVQSAFLKWNTLEHLLKIGMPDSLSSYFHPGELIKIKFEIDTDLPQSFSTEAVPIYWPFPFSIRSYTLPDMFAGKISALLYREWQKRIKGRDWYDFLWFVAKNVPVNLDHLQVRMEQIDKWPSDKALTIDDLRLLIHQKIEGLDLQLAMKDVVPFLRESTALSGWSKELLHRSVDRLRFKTV